MKKLKNSITTLLFITLLMGCNEHKERQYVVEGRLMYSCGVPAANVQDIAIKQVPPAMNLGKDPIFKRFSTDEDGYFKIIYKYKEASSSPMYFAKSGKFFEGIPSYESLDLGEVFYGSPTFSFVIRLEVDKVYTEEDTLFLPDYENNDYIKRPGPFENGVYDTVLNKSYLKCIQYDYPSEFEVRYLWKTKNKEEEMKHSSFKITNFCDNIIYDAVIKIK